MLINNLVFQSMDFLFDLFPVIFFFIAFKLYGIKVAVVVLIIATLVQNIVFWLRHKKFNKMHLVTLGLTAVFGSITLLLNDPIYIQWKPTVIYGLFSAVLLIYPLFKKETLIEKMMGKQMPLKKNIWSNLNLAWGLFFIFMAVANVYVAFYYNSAVTDPESRLSTWVTFRTFGSMILMFAFIIIQMLFLYKHIDMDKINQSKSTEKSSNNDN